MTWSNILKPPFLGSASLTTLYFVKKVVLKYPVVNI